jgi:hypothetical protein
MLWLTIPLFVVVLSALVLWIILYILFCRSPEKKWRDKVLGLVARARRRAYEEEKDLSRLEANRQTEEETIREEAFVSLLASVSVKELEVFAGIGPVTVSKLKSAGYSNLASLQHARIHIHGLGEKRLAEIYHAVHQLTRQANGRFRSGACPEAQGIVPRLNNIHSKYSHLGKMASVRLNAAKAFMDSISESYSLARRLTFIGFWSRDWDDVLPPDMLNQDLPDLDTTIERAEAKALAAIQEKARQIPAPRPLQKKPVLVEEKSAPKTTVQDWKTQPPPVRDQGGRHVPALAVVPVEEKTEPSHVHPDGRVRKPAGVQKSAPPPAPTIREAPPARQALQEAKKENRQVAKMQVAIQFAFALARADVPLSASAKKMIKEYFRNQYCHEAVLLNRANAYCAQFETASIRLEDSLSGIENLLTVEERGSLVRLGERIVKASETESNKAVTLLKKMAGDLKISFLSESSQGAESTAPALPQAILDVNRDECLRVLEIEPHLPFTADLVRRHFNLLTDKFRPERVASLGSEFVETMEKKREKVRTAATFLLGEFGEKLDVPEHSESKGLRDNPDLDAVFGV